MSEDDGRDGDGQGFKVEEKTPKLQGHRDETCQWTSGLRRGGYQVIKVVDRVVTTCMFEPMGTLLCTRM